MNGTVETKIYLHTSLISVFDIHSGTWITANMDKDRYIFTGNWVSGFPSLTVYGSLKDENFALISSSNGKYIKDLDKLSEVGSGYIQVTQLNIEEDLGSSWNNLIKKMIPYNYSDKYNFAATQDCIYSNGKSNIMYIQ